MAAGQRAGRVDARPAAERAQVHPLDVGKGLLEQAEVAQHKRERWIAQEVAWLRKGVEARRTKSKARIERAQKLMAEKGFQRPQVAALQVMAAPRLSATVIEAEKVSQSYGERKVLSGVDLIVHIRRTRDGRTVDTILARRGGPGGGRDLAPVL